METAVSKISAAERQGMINVGYGETAEKVGTGLEVQTELLAECAATVGGGRTGLSQHSAS